MQARSDCIASFQFQVSNDNRPGCRVVKIIEEMHSTMDEFWESIQMTDPKQYRLTQSVKGAG
jgi:hypothetical protein